MELPDVYEFIDHWHAAVKEEVQDNEEKTELDSLSESLKEVVKKSRPIRNLATSPLLCAVLCALHRDRHQQLPSDRIELYGACCHMLLERRGKEQHLLVEIKDYPALSYRQKELLLADFAYWMMVNGWSTVTVDSADEHFSHKLEEHG